jgi:hypothetical protein|nr:MAG TPA: hypothetical protein [Caudoviricetes sp.]
MSEKEKQLNKIKKNVIQRYEWDDKQGTMLVNDFLQLSKIAEDLKENNVKAYSAFMTLLNNKVELLEENWERGKRISRLQKGQTQPKDVK